MLQLQPSPAWPPAAPPCAHGHRGVLACPAHALAPGLGVALGLCSQRATAIAAFSDSPACCVLRAAVPVEKQILQRVKGSCKDEEN